MKGRASVKKICDKCKVITAVASFAFICRERQAQAAPGIKTNKRQFLFCFALAKGPHPLVSRSHLAMNPAEFPETIHRCSISSQIQPEGHPSGHVFAGVDVLITNRRASDSPTSTASATLALPRFLAKADIIPL